VDALDTGFDQVEGEHATPRATLVAEKRWDGIRGAEPGKRVGPPT
jgi:hypothetical protein